MASQRDEGGFHHEVGADFPGYVQIPEDYPLPPVAHRSVFRFCDVAGAWAGVAYADGDVIGLPMYFPNCFRARTLTGLIHTVLLVDPSDSVGTQMDVHFFSSKPTAGTDNSAWAVSDPETINFWRGCVSFATFYDVGGARVSQVVNAGIGLTSTDTGLWGQLIARAAYTISAGFPPRISVHVLQD